MNEGRGERKMKTETEKHEEPDAWRKWIQKGEVAGFASLEMEIKNKIHCTHLVRMVLGQGRAG